MVDRLPLLLLVLTSLLPGTSAALELDDWSWRDGLLGDSIEGDVYGSAAGDYPGFLCIDCRDPEEHPMDFAAFAYNGYWGEDAWMFSSRLGMPFRVYNLDMAWVVVWFEDVLFGTIGLLPDTLQIHVRLETGQVLTFTVIQGGPDLPVGVQEPDVEPDTTVSSCICADEDAGGEADDDYTEPVDAEFPEIEEEYFGTVDILDPDGDGEFPPWEEEL